MQIKRWIPRLVGLLLLLGGGAFLAIAKPWQKSDTGPTYSTVAVGKGSIQAQVSANGTLSAQHTVLVGAQVSGRIVELPKDFNATVKEGELLAKLDDSVLKVQIEQAQAAYDLALANENKAQVAYIDADRQYKRQKTLQDQNLVAGATVDTAEATWRGARAAVTAAQASVGQALANLKQAKTNLTYATINSPINGIVLSRAVELGQTVASSLQAPTLFTIAEDLTKMQIDTSVAESDVGRITDGMKVTFTVDAFPGKAFDGTVRQVRYSPTTVSGVVTYDAVIDVKNEDKQFELRPGMTAQVSFVLAQVADTIKIPNAALRFKPTREQMQAMMQASGRPSDFSGGSGMRGSGGSGRRRDGSGSGGPPDGATGASPQGGGRQGGPKDPDRRAVWKLVDGVPKRVNVKLGLTDGSSTQIVEGDLQPGDQIITEIQGVAAQQRKVGAF